MLSYSSYPHAALAADWRRLPKGRHIVAAIAAGVCLLAYEVAGAKLGHQRKGPASSLKQALACSSGAAGRIRTHDPLVRSQVLYPTELQPRRARNYSSTF